MFSSFRRLVDKHFRRGKNLAKDMYKSNADHEKCERVSGISITNPIPKGTYVPYDEKLLERTRDQWLLGDWERLSQLSREIIQNHPDRAELALYIAAGRIQLKRDPDALYFIQLARNWGVRKKLVGQILVSGLHNTIGRAALINNQTERGLQHFKSAISIGTQTHHGQQLTKALIISQMRQLESIGNELVQKTSRNVLSNIFSERKIHKDNISLTEEYDNNTHPITTLLIFGSCRVKRFRAHLTKNEAKNIRICQHHIHNAFEAKQIINWAESGDFDCAIKYNKIHNEIFARNNSIDSSKYYENLRKSFKESDAIAVEVSSLKRNIFTFEGELVIDGNLTALKYISEEFIEGAKRINQKSSQRDITDALAAIKEICKNKILILIPHYSWNTHQGPLSDRKELREVLLAACNDLDILLLDPDQIIRLYGQERACTSSAHYSKGFERVLSRAFKKGIANMLNSRSFEIRGRQVPPE